MSRFRRLAEILEQRGELLRISREVDPRFEMPALMEQIDQQRQAFLFEKVRGSAFPVIGGLLNRIECYGWGIGSPPERPFGQGDLESRIEAAKAAPLPPVERDKAPVQGVTLTGDGIDLGRLPVPTFFELDSGPFITAAVGISRNPATGQLNAGIYRTLILGQRILAINASSLSDLRQIYAAAERANEAMPIALAIGVDPALLVAASCKLPPDQSELAVAGALQGRPVELVKCLTSELRVPADAEIIIEARVDFSRKISNTLGEFAGQYGPETAPVSEVTAITHRPDPLFYSIMAGRNPEHNTLGSVATYSIKQAIAAGLRRQFPLIRDINVFLDPGLGAMLHIALSISKQDDEQPGRLIDQLFAADGGFFPISHITKRIIVVDDDVNVHDLGDVEWALWSRTADAARYRVIPDVSSWELERCAREGRGSLRLAVDATMAMADREKLRRLVIPGAETIRLADYLDRPLRPAALG